MLGELEEIAAMERMNFIGWYRDATVEEIAIARRNGADRLDELKKKYAAEIELMDIINGWMVTWLVVVETGLKPVSTKAI